MTIEGRILATLVLFVVAFCLVGLTCDPIRVGSKRVHTERWAWRGFSVSFAGLFLLGLWTAWTA